MPPAFTTSLPEPLICPAKVCDVPVPTVPAMLSTVPLFVTSFVKVPPVTRFTASVPAASTITGTEAAMEEPPTSGPVPSPICSVPLFTRVWPMYVLFPVRICVLVPSLKMPPFPLITPAKTAFAVPLTLTPVPKPMVSVLPPSVTFDVVAPESEAMDWFAPAGFTAVPPMFKVEPPSPDAAKAAV